MSEENRPIPISARSQSPADDPHAAGTSESAAPRTEGGGRIFQTPLIDIHEGPEGLVLEADLPGANEKTLEVILEDNVLSLRARAEPDTEPPGRLIHQEFIPGAFARSFILSDEVDRARISAAMKNGVLRLELPRSERARTRRIEVKSP